MHRKRNQVIVAAMAAVLLLTGALNLRGVIGSANDSAWNVDPANRSAVDVLVDAPARLPGALDDQIVSMQDELRAHPNNGAAATALGQAYLQKARETGDPSYYPKAEALFTKAWKLDDRDYAAATGLGTLALARHDFAAGLTWGERARAINGYYSPAFGVIGDAQIELGQYDAAIATIQRMVDLRPDLTSYARVSYVRELMGDLPGAAEAMERAAVAGAARPEHVAWTQVQLGNLAFNQGDLANARMQYEAALWTLEGYVYAVAGLAKVAAAEGDFPAAVTLYQDAVQTMPLPEFVIALGEVHEAAGQSDLAAQQFALVDAMTALYTENGVDTDIEMALFRADHNRDLNEAVEQARTGYAKRPSIKSADVLAWILHATGNDAEAMTYSQEALRLGTKDALALFHAGVIANALGDTAAARTYLEQALTINPYFSVRYAPVARQLLAQLPA